MLKHIRLSAYLGVSISLAGLLGCGAGSNQVTAPTPEYIKSLGEEDPQAVRPTLQSSPAPEIPAPPPPTGG